MFVIFGASSGIGQRLSARLRATTHRVRAVSRSAPGCVVADLATGEGVDDALDGAEIVVSCAHARYTDRLLAALPPSVHRLVLMGSAWRYSLIPNPRADEVRTGEEQFLASGANGVMLHSAMIYGGHHENNIQRLLRFIRKIPIIPAPGGGRHRVQPIFIDDVVSCLLAAALRDWLGPNVLPIAGPQLTWREMVMQCAAAINRRPLVLPVPTIPVLTAINCLDRLGFAPIRPDMIRRFSENVDIPLAAITELLGISPRDFADGIALAVREWHQARAI